MGLKTTYHAIAETKRTFQKNWKQNDSLRDRRFKRFGLTLLDTLDSLEPKKTADGKERVAPILLAAGGIFLGVTLTKYFWDDRDLVMHRIRQHL